MMFRHEKLEDGSVKIMGVLATPRVSRNGYFYPPEELERAVKKLGGREIPIYLEHVDARNAIGSAKLVWNPEKMQVEFEGRVTDPEIAQKILDGAIRHVSLGADYETLDFMDGYAAVRGLEFKELSLVAVPGIPEANIMVAESLDVAIRLREELIEAVPRWEPTKKAPEDRPWDGDAARRRLREWSGYPEGQWWNKYKRGFAWFDDREPEKLSSYKLPHHDIIDGEIHVVWRGVAAAMAALMGARGGTDIPSGERRAVYNHLARHYKQFNKEPPSFESVERLWQILNKPREEAVEGLREFLAEVKKREFQAIVDTLVEGDAGEAIALLHEAASYAKYVPDSDKSDSMAEEGKIGESLEAKIEQLTAETKTLSEAITKGFEAVKESLSKLTEPKEEEGPKETVEESVSDSAKLYESVAQKLREAITSTSAPVIPEWKPPIIDLPPGVQAGLRRYARVVEIPKGASKVTVSTLTTPAFAALTEGASIADATQTLSHVEVSAGEYGAAQTVTDTVLETMSADLVQAIERTFQRAAVRSEDNVILSKLDAATGVNELFAGGKENEDSLDTLDVLTWQLVLEAKKVLSEKGYDTSPGNLVLVVSPKQWLDLMKNLGSALVSAGDREFIGTGEVVRLFGIDIVISDQVPTGTATQGGTTSITTYHAFMFIKGESVALAVARDLRVELDRDINKRTTNIVATHRIGSEVIVPESVVKIYTT